MAKTSGRSGESKKEQSKVAITKRLVDGASQPGLYLDEKLEGFRLKVTEAGSKVFLVYGKVKGERRILNGREAPGTPVKVTIGRYGQKLPDGTDLTADKAREMATQIRGQMLAGINPNKERDKEQRVKAEEAKAEADREKVRDLTLAVGFNKHLEKGHKPSTVNGYKKVISACLKDWLNKPLVDITNDAVIERFDMIHKRSPSNAAHAIRLLKAVFKTVRITFGKNIPELSSLNPTESLTHWRKDWNSIEPRGDYIPDEDLPAFYKAVTGLSSYTARDYLMVAILTGLRKGEICTLKWKENIDLTRKVITVTGEQAKNKQRHMLAMSDFLYKLFLKRWESRDSEYVFPGRSKAGCYDDPEKSIDQVIDATGVKFSSHSLRRTFATAADAVGYDLRNIQRLLNHKPGSVADKHYIQRHAEKTREPMQRINDHLLGLMEAEPKVEASKVVPLTKVSS